MYAGLKFDIMARFAEHSGRWRFQCRRKPDIIAGKGNGSCGLTLLPGLGNGLFGTPLTNFTVIGSGLSDQTLALGDFDGDNLVDIALPSAALPI